MTANRGVGHVGLTITVHLTQSDGHLKDSTMRTYTSNLRYVVQYVAARDDQHITMIPMDTYLANQGLHYQRSVGASQSDKSWQVLDSKGQWIHW